MKSIIIFILFILPPLVCAAVSSADYKLLKKDFENPATWSHMTEGPRFNLSIYVDWSNQGVVAYSSNPIYLSGGLIAHPEMNLDTLAMVVCHEFGHGEPVLDFYYQDLYFGWDHLFQDYYAANICFKNYLKGSSLNKRFPDQIPNALVQKCKIAYSGEVTDYCQRSLSAANRFIKILYSVLKNFEPYSKLPAPGFQRQWLHERDFLQGRLENFIRATFGEAPFSGAKKL
jgi:hypothetical protein